MQVFLQTPDIEYELTDGLPFTIIQLDGISNAKAIPATERGPLQHGDTMLDYRLEPRMIIIKLQAHPSTSYSYRAIRNLLTNIFNPYNGDMPFTVLFNGNEIGALETVQARAITARAIGEPNIISSLVQTAHLTAVVTLRASDPIWYDPSINLINIRGVIINNETRIPTTIPTFIEVGSSNNFMPINYTGTWPEYPVIRLDGPLGGPIITNLTTGKKIDLSGAVVPDGRVYIVDLRYGAKRIYDEADPITNLTYLATADSDLATFALVPGTNDLRVTAGLVTSGSDIFLNYYNRFVGI